jgi:hypothetical protein
MIMAISLISAPKPSDDNLVAKANSSRSFADRTKIETNKETEVKSAGKATNVANTSNDQNTQKAQQTEASKPSLNTQGQVTGTMINTIA